MRANCSFDLTGSELLLGVLLHVLLRGCGKAGVQMQMQALYAVQVGRATGAWVWVREPCGRVAQADWALGWGGLGTVSGLESEIAGYSILETAWHCARLLDRDATFC